MATGAAKRYARAAFDLAQDEGRVDAWRTDLASIRELLSDPAVAAGLSNPTIPVTQRLGLVAGSTGPDSEALNLLRLLIESGRVDEATGIVEEFDRLANEAAGKVHALITTAVELSPDERNELASKLSKKIGAEVSVQSVVDSRIIGGLKVQYGDHLIDATVATRLQQLRRRLADAS